jgi:AmpD protein
MNIDDRGCVDSARWISSPHCDERPQDAIIRLLVIHAISLPPCRFSGDAVIRFFRGNELDPAEHPFYSQIVGLRVSAHFFIRRRGQLIQFVPCDLRAWHAGVSCWKKQTACNDFSIGVELEGCDERPYTAAQYRRLAQLARVLAQHYPLEAIVGHADIAPGRKTDPGRYFDWRALGRLLGEPYSRLLIAREHNAQTLR